jgi:hypothetical protein
VRRLVVEALPADLDKWLALEAAKSGVSPAVMARAMLVDAIEDAREKK